MICKIYRSFDAGNFSTETEHLNSTRLFAALFVDKFHVGQYRW